MTVQTQGILLNLTPMKANPSKETSQAKSNEFDQFMKKNGLACQEPKEESPVISKENQVSLVNTKGTQVAKPTEEVTSKDMDVTTVATKVEQLLEDTFELTQEQLEDIMSQMGITPADLLFSEPDVQGNIQMIDVSKMKSLVLEVHGVADETAFLTNPDLNQELTQLIKGMETLISKELELSPEKINQLLKAGVSEFTEGTLDESAQQTQENVVTKTEVENVGISLVNGEGKKEVQQTDPKAVLEAMTRETKGQSNGETSAGTNMNQEKGSNNLPGEKTSEVSVTTEKTVSTTSNEESPVNPFLEKITKAFESLGNDLKTSQTMSKIVEQVISQIRVRVVPETTQMDLTLNPANLGKVNISVSAENGVATATITVQNQTTKDALVGQMAVLKESFEQKGMKVESVEVNVSNFDFTRDESQGNQNQNAQQKEPLRKIRIGMDGFPMDQVEEEAMTTSNQDTVIDYTA